MLNKNQEIRLSITSLSVEGAGIGKTDDGITIFVSDALPGDEVLAHIIKVKKNICYRNHKRAYNAFTLQSGGVVPCSKEMRRLYVPASVVCKAA